MVHQCYICPPCCAAARQAYFYLKCRVGFGFALFHSWSFSLNLIFFRSTPCWIRYQNFHPFKGWVILHVYTAHLVDPFAINKYSLCFSGFYLIWLCLGMQSQEQLGLSSNSCSSCLSPRVLGLEHGHHAQGFYPGLMGMDYSHWLLSVAAVSTKWQTSHWVLAPSSSGYLPRSRTAGTHDCSLLIFFSESLYSLSWRLTNWTILPSIPNDSSFCISVTTLAVVCVSLYSSHPNWCGVAFHYCFELPFPNIIKHIVLGLYNIIFSFEKCLFAHC